MLLTALPTGAALSLGVALGAIFADLLSSGKARDLEREILALTLNAQGSADPTEDNNP